MMYIGLNSPVLSQAKLRQLLGPGMFRDSHVFVDLNVDDTMSLPDALDQVCEQAETAVRNGKLIIMLSDRYLERVERLCERVWPLGLGTDVIVGFRNAYEADTMTLQQKLDAMRQTVDETLQSTLEKRLGESFKLVGDRLEAVVDHGNRVTVLSQKPLGQFLINETVFGHENPQFAGRGV